MTNMANVETQQFISREIQSPIKDQGGVSKTVFSHISNLHSFFNNWVRMSDKGVRQLKAITALKLQEYNDDYYPSQLKQLMDNIVEIVDSLRNIVEGVNTIQNQLQALSKLQPTSAPVISTWSAKQIVDCVQNIHNSLLKEYRLKEVIAENVAHCRDENLIEVYVSSWEFEPYFNCDSHAYLFAEVGLPQIT